MLHQSKRFPDPPLPALPLDRTADPPRHGEPQPHSRHAALRRLFERPLRCMHENDAIACDISSREDALKGGPSRKPHCS